MENGTENFIHPVLSVFKDENWNVLDGNQAYVTRCLKRFLGIYRSLLYMKAFASYKVTTKHVENGTVWFFTYISQALSCTVEIGISLESFQTGGWHRLSCYPIRSSFHRCKRGKRDIRSFLCSAFHVFNGGK